MMLGTRLPFKIIGEPILRAIPIANMTFREPQAIVFHSDVAVFAFHTV